MGDGFLVSVDSHLDGIASALGSNELATSFKLGASATRSGRAGHAAAPARRLGRQGPAGSRSTLLEPSPQRRDRVRADRRVEVAHQQGEPPPFEVGVPPAGIRPNLDGPKSSLARRRSAGNLWPGISLYRSVCSWSGLNAARPRHGD
jgi:hypothetical protein